MNAEKEAKMIREELAYIGRFMDSINPKLAIYSEKQKRKEQLRKRLKELTNSLKRN